MSVCRKITLILLCIGLFALSGCEHNGDFSSDTDVNEGISTGSAETENKAEIENKVEAEDSGMAGSAQSQLKPLEVPVSSREEDILYHKVDDIDICWSQQRCQSDGENIYLVYGQPDLYVMPIGADEHTRVNIDNPDGMFICHIAMDIYGKIHLLVEGNDFEEWYIWRLNESKQVDKVIDISDYFEIKQMPRWFLVDKDGNYYLQWVLSRDGVIVDSEGELKHRFTMESLDTRWTYEAAVGKDGLIYVVYNDGDEKVRIGEFDVESCSIIRDDSPLYFSRGAEIFSVMSRGTDTNLLLYSRESGIWAYDHEKGILENRVPLSDIGVAHGDSDSCPLTFLPDGRFLLLDIREDGHHIRYIPAGK